MQRHRWGRKSGTRRQNLEKNAQGESRISGSLQMRDEEGKFSFLASLDRACPSPLTPDQVSGLQSCEEERRCCCKPPPTSGVR